MLTVDPSTGNALLPEPAMALRHTTGDAGALLGLWLVRRAFWALLWLGLIAIVLTGTFDDLQATTVTTELEFGSLALVPRMLLVLAATTRLSSGWLAILLAYPLARRVQRHAEGERPRHWWRASVWSDRWTLARALRDWRWTSPVLTLARQRVGRAGRPILVTGVVLRAAGILLFPTMFALLVTRLG